MSVFLATLVLNEMEFLPALYAQHRDWPELACWCFVEAADRAYANANPDMVSPEGLSVDGTSEFLRGLAEADPRVVYIPHGFSDHPDPAVGKAAARQRHLEMADVVKPEFVVALDADEFYTSDDQAKLVQWMRRYRKASAFVFPKREIWRPPSIANQPLFQYEAVGGFWGIDCCHWWRWQPGMNHGRCHNAPDGANGQPLNWNMQRLANRADAPQMIHLGYAAQAKTRAAKNAYYAARGEAVDRKRRWYVQSRRDWERWRPGNKLPRRAQVVPYRGPVPEVFQ